MDWRTGWRMANLPLTARIIRNLNQMQPENGLRVVFYNPATELGKLHGSTGTFRRADQRSFSLSHHEDIVGQAKFGLWQSHS